MFRLHVKRRPASAVDVAAAWMVIYVGLSSHLNTRGASTLYS